MHAFHVVCQHQQRTRENGPKLCIKGHDVKEEKGVMKLKMR